MPEHFINKNTFNDKVKVLQKLLVSEFPKSDVYLIDADDEYVYFEMYFSGEYSTFRLTYVLSDLDVTFGDDLVEVMRLSTYKEVGDKGILGGMLTKALTKFLPKETPVIKSFSEMEKKSIEFMYIAPEETDLVGDTISYETSVKMVDSFNEVIKTKDLENFFHKLPAVNRSGEKIFEYTKAFVVEEDSLYGDVVVKKGQALVEVQWNSDLAFEMRMEGRLGAPSIGALARGVYINES